MNKQQASVTNTEIVTTVQTKMLPALIEWGVGFSFILVCVTVGGVTLYFSLHFIGFQIGGVVGGITIGCTPYITQQIRIPGIRWQAILFTNLTIIVVFWVISAYYLYQSALTAQILSEANGHFSMTIYSRFASGIRLLFLMTLSSSAVGAIVGVITRWAYRRWLRLKQKHLALGALFVILLFGLLPHQATIWNCQFLPSLLLPIFGILWIFLFIKGVPNDSKSSKQLPFPLLIGFMVASIHFVSSYFLIELPLTGLCAPNMLYVFLMAPWIIGELPIISSLIDMLTIIRVNEFYLLVLISSCYYGCASVFLVSKQKYHLLIGITLFSISILLVSFYYFAVLATGCGA